MRGRSAGDGADMCRAPRAAHRVLPAPAAVVRAGDKIRKRGAVRVGRGEGASARAARRRPPRSSVELLSLGRARQRGGGAGLIRHLASWGWAACVFGCLGPGGTGWWQARGPRPTANNALPQPEHVTRPTHARACGHASPLPAPFAPAGRSSRCRQRPGASRPRSPASRRQTPPPAGGRAAKRAGQPTPRRRRRPPGNPLLAHTCSCPHAATARPRACRGAPDAPLPGPARTCRSA